MDDIVDVCGYDAKPSIEDGIMPVETVYETYGRRNAILVIIDVDVLCRSAPEAVRACSRRILDLAAERGGYALCSGNSISECVPQENYLAMISAAMA